MGQSQKWVPRDKIYMAHERLIHMGFLAASFAGLLVLVSLQSLDAPLRISSYAFAIPIPLLACYAYVIDIEQQIGVYRYPNLREMTSIVGLLTSLIGTTCLFWHLSWLSGAAFIVFSISAYAVAMVLEERLLQSVEKTANKRIESDEG